MNFNGMYQHSKHKEIQVPLIKVLLKQNIMKAIWKGKIIAQSNETVMVENNHYFPPESINREYIMDNDTHTTCPWKGLASYYDIVVDGEINKDAAWYYPHPKPLVKKLANYVAFWKGVEIIKD